MTTIRFHSQAPSHLLQRWLRRLAAAGLLAALPAAPAISGDAVAYLDLPAPAAELRQVGDRVFVRAGSWHHLRPCEGALVCATAGTPPTNATATDGIPVGTIATRPTGDIRRAWYTKPTTRYGHGILGDRIEGGGLAVTDNRRQRDDLALPDTHVFEDLTPRIVDLDRDGNSEVVTIRSDTNAGAAIAVYHLREGRLSERAAIAPIGLAHRWLNVAGIADYTGDGRLEIAIVKTPHIGGRFELWSLSRDRLKLIAAAEGFSNHAIGSTDQGLSATADFNGDGIVDIAVPDARRAALRILAVAGGKLSEIDRMPLAARIVTNLGVLETPGGPVLLAGLDNGRLAVLTP